MQKYACQHEKYRIDSQQKYNVKQSEPISYNGIDFDSDTAIGDDYGQW